MENVKNYFSSWKTFWKFSTNSCNSGTLSLAPSNINFTNSSLGDLKNTTIDETLMIDISTKLMESVSPPKLQVYAHGNQWFALNNSHLLVYRQLERIGLCDTVVCDIIRSQDVPIGIRQTLVPIVKSQQENSQFIKNSRDYTINDNYMMTNDEVPHSQDEVVYCADIQADSCGCLEDEDQYDSSNITCGNSDNESDSDDERTEWSTNKSISLARISTISMNGFNDNDLEDNCIDDNQKELQSLL